MGVLTATTQEASFRPIWILPRFVAERGLAHIGGTAFFPGMELGGSLAAKGRDPSCSSTSLLLRRCAHQRMRARQRRIALEALVSQLRAETVQLAEAVARVPKRGLMLERGFETEESDLVWSRSGSPLGFLGGSAVRHHVHHTSCSAAHHFRIASIGCVVTVQEATISLKSTFVRSVQLLRPMGDDTTADF